MKYLRAVYLFLAIAICFFPDLSAQGSNDEKFKSGVTEYSAGNYEKALEIWSDLYNAGYRSPELAYNTGNAYFKLNNVPGAILFYERAARLSPADEDIIYNLGIARTMAVDRIEAIPELFFVKWYDFLSLLVPANTWALLSVISFAVSLLLISFYLYSRSVRIKIGSFWLGLVFFVLSLSSFTLAFRNDYLVRGGHEGIIFSPLVAGKSSPDDSGTDLFVLHEGTKVKIVDTIGKWYEIRLADGNKGWVPSNSLEII